MGKFSLLNTAIWMDATDMTSYQSKVSIHPTVDELDVTVFAAGAKGRIGGLRTVDWSGDGFMDTTAAPDAEIWSNVGVKDVVLTASSEGAETNTAWMWLSELAEYAQGDAVGAAMPWHAAGKGSSAQGLVRGQMGSIKRVVAATGQLGSVLTMAGPVTGQFLYATIHAFVVGTTVTIQVQSATTFGFAGPTTRGTFAAITAVGGYWLVRVPGPITDGFFRFNVSAITGSFTVAGAIGVGS